MPVFMLTTKDNPYSPFTHFDEWNAWDTSHGYHTCAYLARIAHDSPELSAAQNSRAIEDAIDEIVSYNLTGNYVKVVERDYKNWVPSDTPSNGTAPLSRAQQDVN